MVLVAIIEIPKGDGRRRHLKQDKSGFIDLGPTKDVIPVNDGIMPVHYGFIQGTVNEAEKDEVDVLVFSDKKLVVGEEVPITPIALIRRADGDDKIVAADSTTQRRFKKWEDIPKKERELVTQFFSYHHKFLSIEGKKEAVEYIHRSMHQ
ncbi:MAG: Inorganic pyrophosphatase [Candidatus Daviesbacteria bacterium GW2011_GWA1_38_7]|nr:MAG: Inorganic pyrophosphatase [Candidatus Daviesbacteria bacterium GW2011_GWA1_38_7]